MEKGAEEQGQDLFSANSSPPMYGAARLVSPL